jgi:hypothetical protein
VQNAVDSSKLKPGFEGEVDPLLTGGGDSSEPDKERERALALAKSLSDQMVLIGTEGRVKEFEQAEIKYRNQFDLLDKFGIDTGNLSKLHREAIYSINEKWDKKDAESLAKAEKEKAARRKAFDDVALAASNEAYVNSLADDEARDMYKLELEMQRLNEAARLKFAKLDTARKNQVDLNNVYANIEANIDKKKTDIAIKYSEERIKQAEKESEMKLAAANQFFGGWGALTAEAAKRDKAYSKLAKTLLIMQATMNMFASASKSLAIYGYTPTGLAAASGAMAQGAANIAGISSQSFANGGIVQGNSYTGDNVKANVNSGEMILNQAQQRHLFAVANGRVNPVSSNVNNTSSTIGDIYINATPDTDTEKVKNAVLEAISESNISQARRERQNLEFGVTA